MPEKNYDWSSFTCKININKSVEEVYDAWTIPKRLETWFIRVADFSRKDKDTREKETHIQQGDSYIWQWYAYPEDVVEKGEVLEANGEHKLRFSFIRGAEVIVDIGRVGNETIVMLTQHNMPTDEASKSSIHLDCFAGWTFYLTNLKSVLEGGIDLRNKNPDLKNMVNS